MTSIPRPKDKCYKYPPPKLHYMETEIGQTVGEHWGALPKHK